MTPLQYIISLAEEKTSFSIRFMRLSFCKADYIHINGTIFLLVEYLQLISQYILANHYYNYSSTSEKLLLKDLILPFAKIFDPGYILRFNDNANFLYTIFSITAFISLFKFSLLVFTIMTANKKSRENSVLLSLWRFVFQTQGRVVCFFISSFLMEVLLTQKQSLSVSHDAYKYALISLSGILVLTEYALAFLLNYYYGYILPTKSLLSSKSNVLVRATLLQKLIIHILRICLSDHYLANTWILTSIGVLFSIYRIYYFITVLPFHRSKTNYHQGKLLMIVLSLDLSFFSQIIRKASEYEADIESMFILWVALSVIATTMMHCYLRKKFLDIVVKLVKGPPEVVLHKIFLLKELRNRNKNSNEYSQNYHWTYLAMADIDRNFKDAFGLTRSLNIDRPAILNPKSSLKEFYIEYLNTFSNKFPQSQIIKLYLTYFYISKFKRHPTVFKILIDLQRSTSHTIKFHVLLLLEKLQASLREKSQGDNSIDIYSYIQDTVNMAKLKEKMLSQANSQIELYQEMNQASPDLAKIFNFAQEAHKCRHSLEKGIRSIKELIPSHYLEPCTLFAHYSLILNHDIPAYLDGSRAFLNKLRKYEKSSKGNSLSQENLYDKDSGAVIYSGQSDNRRVITYCSKKIVQLSGKDLTGEHLSHLFPPLLRQAYSQRIIEYDNKENTDSANTTIQLFGYNNEGYLYLIDYYTKIYPFLLQGLHYMAIIRPVIQRKEYILIGKNGDIHGFTKKIGEKLELISHKELQPSSNLKIGDISPELEEVSRAFDVIYQLSILPKIEKMEVSLRTFTEEKTPSSKGILRRVIREKTQKSTMSIRKAKRLYEIYITVGEYMDISPLSVSKEKRSTCSLTIDPQSIFSFHCKMEIKTYGNLVLKVLSLEDIEELEEEGQTEIEVPNIDESLNLRGKSRTIDNIMLIKQANEEDRPKIFPECRVTFKDPSPRNNDTEERKRSSQSIATLNKFDDPTSKTLETETYLLKTPATQENQTLETEEFASSARNVLFRNSLQAKQVTGETILTSPRGSPLRKPKRTLQNSQRIESYSEEEDKEEELEALDTGSLSSQHSNSSSQLKISKAVNESLRRKNRSKTHTLFLILLGIMVLGFIASQTYMKITLNRYIENLSYRKDVLLFAQQRSLKLIETHIHLRTIWMYGMGMVSEEGNVPVFFLTIVAKGLLTDLTTLNRNLRLAVNSLDISDSQELFIANVLMFDNDYNSTSQTNLSLTTFDATDQIVAESLKTLSLAATGPRNALTQLNPILRNIPNDLLVRASEISDILVDEISKDLTLNLGALNIGFILVALLWLIIFVSFAILLYRHYIKEKKHMLAFSKLNLVEINIVKARIQKFKDMVLEEASFEENTDIELLERYFKINHKLIRAARGKKEDLRYEPNHQGIRKKYWVYAIHLSSLMILLAVFLGLDFIFSRQLMVYLDKKIHQFDVVGRFILRTDLVGLTFMDLFARNGTSKVMNVATPYWADENIIMVRDSRNEMIDLFQGDKEAQDNGIDSILYTNQCSSFGVFADGCNSMANGRQNAGLIQLSTDVEMILVNLKNEYDELNKTSELLNTLQNTMENSTIREVLLLQNLSSTIPSLINRNVEDEIRQGRKYILLIALLVLILLLLFPLLIYFKALLKVTESENGFKRVLQTVPGSLVLSNYLLKYYVRSIARDSLDSIRNEI